MIWELVKLTTQRKTAKGTVMSVSIYSKEESHLFRKPWFTSVPGKWCEIGEIFRVSGPQATLTEFKDFYIHYLPIVFEGVGWPVLCQGDRVHAKLLRGVAKRLKYKFKFLQGSLADPTSKIKDYGPYGGSDDEQVIMIEEQ